MADASQGKEAFYRSTARKTGTAIADTSRVHLPARAADDSDVPAGTPEQPVLSP